VNEPVHVPVMAAEVNVLLLANGGTRFLDCTAGGGGHIAALIEAANRPIEVCGIDVDPVAVSSCQARFAGNSAVQVAVGDYSDPVKAALAFGGGTFDGVLCDLGQSSDQLDDPARGMSHRFEAPLDMRYNQRSGPTAAELLNHSDLRELIHIFGVLGGERNAPRIARAVIRERPVETTSRLNEVISRSSGQAFLQKTLSRCYMGLRVAVNHELEAIDCFLLHSLELLRKQGRLVCLSYDSSQDGRTKNFFRSRAHPCTCPPRLPVCLCGRRPDLKILTLHPEYPSPEEEASNPRSRSARLRAAEKL